MPRRGTSSPSRSSSQTSRSSATKTAPTQNNNNQVSRPGTGLAGGLMGSMMTGMAFGAGSEMMRQMFRNPGTSSFMMPLLLSGMTAFGANKMLIKPGPNKMLYTVGVFGAAFIVTKSMFGSGSSEGEMMH